MMMVGAQQAVDLALPGQHWQPCHAAAQVALARGAATELVNTRHIPASSRVAAEATYWRAEAAHQQGQITLARKHLVAAGSGQGSARSLTPDWR